MTNPTAPYERWLLYLSLLLAVGAISLSAYLMLISKPPYPPERPPTPWLDYPGTPENTHTRDAAPPVLLPPPDLFNP